MGATHSYGSSNPNPGLHGEDQYLRAGTMASKGSCKSTVMLAHQDAGPVPTGPAGSGREDVEHQCSGSDDGKNHIHYCGCGVSWNSQGVITEAPWLKD
jgi:hypothetical protein